MTNEQIADGLKRFMDAAAQYMGDDYPFVLAAEARLRAPAALEGWQPIETAPKDGTCVLVGNTHGSWIAKYLPVYQSGFRPDNPWSSMMLNHDHIGEKWHPPTHWMPLPAAPGSAPSGVSAPAAEPCVEYDLIGQKACSEHCAAAPAANAQPGELPPLSESWFDLAAVAFVEAMPPGGLSDIGIAKCRNALRAAFSAVWTHPFFIEAALAHAQSDASPRKHLPTAAEIIAQDPELGTPSASWQRGWDDCRSYAIANAPMPSILSMVERFVGWPLPKDFSPDCGISFDGRKDDQWNKNKTWPTGTNLLTVAQAKAMFEHCLQGMAQSDSAAEYGWCLERGSAATPEYLYVSSNQILEWTLDHMKAIRFARRADAEQLAVIVEDCDRIAEHQWGGGIAQSDSAGDASKVAVDVEALGKVLQALVGPEDRIRELQVLARSHFFGEVSPINKLIEQYNAAIAASAATKGEQQ